MSGYDVEHIIVIGQRGMSDDAIRERISQEELIFLTQDSEFENIPLGHGGTIIISRIKQSLPIEKRTQIWFDAVEKFLTERPKGMLFELLETGEVVAWEVHDSE